MTGLRRLFPLAAAVGFVGAALLAMPVGSAGAAAESTKQTTRVLYVEGTQTYGGGKPDPERAEDFRRFLGEWFATVKTCKDVDFKRETADGVDVVVVDGDLRKRLPADFFRPMVLMGGDFSPLMLAEQRGYKLQNT
jgi:hypothetical protein